jgi:hypothetical protein
MVLLSLNLFGCAWTTDGRGPVMLISYKVIMEEEDLQIPEPEPESHLHDIAVMTGLPPMYIVAIAADLVALPFTVPYGLIFWEDEEKDEA